MSLTEFKSSYLNVDQRDGITIVSFTEPSLTEDINIEQIGRDMFQLVEKYACHKLIVSLQDVQVITSAILGKFITLHRKVGREGGTLVFCDLAGQVSQAFKTSNLIRYFKVQPDINSSLASFGEATQQAG